MRIRFFQDGPAISKPLRSRSNQSNLPVLQEPFPGRQLGSIMSHWSSLAINWSPPGHIFIPQRTWLASCWSAMNCKTHLQWEIESNFSIKCWMQIRNCLRFASMHQPLCERCEKTRTPHVQIKCETVNRRGQSADAYSILSTITFLSHWLMLMFTLILTGCCHNFGFRFSKTDS